MKLGLKIGLLTLQLVDSANFDFTSVPSRERLVLKNAQPAEGDSSSECHPRLPGSLLTAAELSFLIFKIDFT